MIDNPERRDPQNSQINNESTPPVTPMHSWDLQTITRTSRERDDEKWTSRWIEAMETYAREYGVSHGK